MNTQNDTELVNDSLERCNRHSGFFDAFYERFVSASPEIADRFDGADIKAQGKALRLAFYLLLRAIDGDPTAWQQLELRAIRHSRDNLDIQPWMYDVWADSMLETVIEFDTACTPATEAAWRRVIQQGIDFMVSRY